MSGRWGDADFEDENGGDELPANYETPLRDGVKDVVEYKLNEDGKKVKVTRKIRITKEKRRVHKSVAERKQWKKFGDCFGLPPGPESGVTMRGDEVTIEPANREKQTKTPKKETVALGIQCRNCGGDHWTLKCPYKDKLEEFMEKSSENDALAAQQMAAGNAGGDGGDSGSGYVVPARRGGGNRDGDRMGSRDDTATATLRVTNLAEETHEEDLQAMFRPFGPIARIYLAKDKHTGATKGFAFVNFYRREDAQNAMDALTGVGLNHLILNLEWAKPSTGDRR